MLHNLTSEFLDDIVNASALRVFDERACAFLSALSSRLLVVGRSYSDVVTFAYWCRRSALRAYEEQCSSADRRLGRGVVFHIAPSNVPVNFAFSLAAGLLAGNKNIVKVPSKEFSQVELISDEIDRLLDTDFADMRPYVVLVRYERGCGLTERLSSICSSRVIWGGDQTVSAVRTCSLPPRSNEITFADRNSLCVISARDSLQSDSFVDLANSFYNDTYFSDQNACTSPRIVVWFGNLSDCSLARQKFWSCVQRKVEAGYDLPAVRVVGKIEALFASAAHRKEILASSLSDTKVMRVEVEELDDSLFDDRYHSGFFFEYCTENLRDLMPLFGGKTQTVSYFGVTVRDAVRDLVFSEGVSGVDRIVPMGRTMDFSLVWDGVDLVVALSREVGVI